MQKPPLVVTVGAGILLGVVIVATACTTLPESRWRAGLETSSEAPLFRAPKNWRVVRERRDDGLYQADLQNREGAGRVMVAQLENASDIDGLEGHVRAVQRSMVERIREDVEVEGEPRVQSVRWSNGAIGYRTAISGELEFRPVRLRGLVVSGGGSTCIVYVLVPNRMEERSKLIFESILETLRPIREADLVGADESKASGSGGSSSSGGTGNVRDDLPSVVPER